MATKNPQTATSAAALAAGARRETAAGAAPTAAAQVSAAASEGGPETTVVATGLTGAAVALGLDPEVKVIDPDPGVGANRRAVETEDVRTVSRETGLRDAPLDADERAELLQLRRLRDEPFEVARPHERRVAVAATQILRDGRTYLPHQSILLDLEGHAELRAIGAIMDTPWERLLPAED